MSRIAFLYPGQGAQEMGMAKDFYENSPEARELFDQASEMLDLDLCKLCFEENDLLDKTEYTQAAMVAACLAITGELKKRGLHPDMTAGLSLGEYCAIAAAGGMSDLDAVRTVRARGIFMEHAAPEGTGAMSAILGMENSSVEKVMQEIDGAYIANYNCPGQIVITGEKEAVERAGKALKEAGARKVLPLKVSGPFHSPMMENAGEKLKKVLEEVTLKKPSVPYVTNVTAELVTEKEPIRELLVKQVSSSVRWEQSIRNMIAEGIDTFVEIGPGKTLSSFMKKTDRNVTMYRVGTWEEAETVCSEILKGI
ncbi:MAG: ACP S-malonyltransferase [Blautia sp.]|uniref:ACP S-malonyltransferase n=1 Tax=Blautia sp. TaxID=1955243 RepID=UPI002A75E28D|nr:ACP S-malonyltransferase [Blautia sp.]MDY3018014.1 ACP S-malonyltransferase [Blautia sp.]